PGHPHEACRPALERAVRSSLIVRCGQEEIRKALDKRLVVGGKFLACEPLLQPIRNAAAVEAILQPSLGFMKHHALGHGDTSSAAALSHLDRTWNEHSIWRSGPIRQPCPRPRHIACHQAIIGDATPLAGSPPYAATLRKSKIPRDTL